jgi:hypothetical protein
MQSLQSPYKQCGRGSAISPKGWEKTGITDLVEWKQEPIEHFWIFSLTYAMYFSTCCAIFISFSFLLRNLMLLSPLNYEN